MSLCCLTLALIKKLSDWRVVYLCIPMTSRWVAMRNLQGFEGRRNVDKEVVQSSIAWCCIAHVFLWWNHHYHTNNEFYNSDDAKQVLWHSLLFTSHLKVLFPEFPFLWGYLLSTISEHLPCSWLQGRPWLMLSCHVMASPPWQGVHSTGNSDSELLLQSTTTALLQCDLLRRKKATVL